MHAVDVPTLTAQACFLIGKKYIHPPVVTSKRWRRSAARRALSGTASDAAGLQLGLRGTRVGLAVHVARRPAPLTHPYPTAPAALRGAETPAVCRHARKETLQRTLPRSLPRRSPRPAPQCWAKHQNFESTCIAGHLTHCWAAHCCQSHLPPRLPPARAPPPPGAAAAAQAGPAAREVTQPCRAWSGELHRTARVLA